MLRLGKLTDYATVILSMMAKDRGNMHAANEIADITGIAPATVSKLLKMLAKAELVSSTRGARGGYELAKAPEHITVACIIHAVEGPIALTECSISQQTCEQAGGCEIRGGWGKINQTIFNALDSVTLADLILPSSNPKEYYIPVASLHR
ncbi:MAG: SUF system Fe-S cluster assembly regulator [Methylomicrobium sp.]